MRKVRISVGVLLALLLLAAGAQARVPEKDFLRNSHLLGDFRKADETREKDRANLSVWENYREFMEKQSSRLKPLMLQGPMALEVAYDEIWEKETGADPTLVVPRPRHGKLLKIRLYWLKGRLQAYTVWKYFRTDPLTWEALDKPGYRVIVLLDRKTLQPELAKLEAKAEVFETMAPALHLQEAQKALAAGNPNVKDIKKRTYGRLEDARRHLEAIGRDADAYDAAQDLMKEVERREKDLKKYQEVMRQAISEREINKRKEMVKELDRDFLSKGFDVKIDLSGEEKTVLKMDCIVFSRPMVFVFVDKTDLLKRLRDAGFEEVVFSNKKISYDWDIDLNN